MSGWGGFGFSGALKNLSTTIFTENLADELEDPNPSHVAISSRVVEAAPQGREVIGVANTPRRLRNDNPSSDNLQQQMNDIMMNHPTIWQLYKKELSQATNPNDPLIVRNLFEEFLEKHHDEIISQQQQQQQQNIDRSSSSIFHKAFSGIQVAGLQEEEEEQQQSHHHHHHHHHQDAITNRNTSSTRPCPSSVIQSQPELQQDITEIDDTNDDNKRNDRNIDYENLDPEEMQQIMKLAMSKPDLWAMYKKKLSQQPNKRHPETVRNVFVEFLKEHGHEIHDPKGQQQQQKPPLSTSTSAAPLHSSKNRKFQAAAPTEPPPSSSSVSTTKQHNSLFDSLNKSLHELNMSLHEEQGRTLSSATTTSRKSRGQHQKNDNKNKQEEQKRHRHDKEKQQQQQQQHGARDEMQLLRCHPTLYPQFQEDLQSTSMVADDFVTDFLKGHENELHEYEKQQQIDKQRRQEKEAAAAAAAAKKASSQSVFQSLNMSMHEESMHYSQPQHHQSEKDTKRVATTEEERKQHQQHGRPQQQQQQRRHSHQRQMYNKESISSRSARKLQVAMDSLAGEVEEGGNSSVVVVPPHPPQSANENSDEHDGKSTRPNNRRRQMYNRESIASQSARKLKNAMDSLAGEMKEEEEAGVVPPQSSFSDHGENMSRNSRRKMYHRESIASRSARQLQIAMDSLAGETKEESASVRSSRGKDIATSATRRRSSSGRGGGGSFKPGEGSQRRPMMYQRESISSRSARSLKIAIDSLAGEVDDGTTTTVTKQQHRPEIIVDVSKKGSDDHTRMQEVDLIGNGMGSDEISTSPSQRIRKSIKTISNRFTTEMVGSFSKGLDLDSEVSPEGSSSRRRVNTEEDLPTSADTDDDDRTFHKSCPIHFAPVVEEESDDDWVLSEASDIALRRRRNSHSISNKPSSSTTLKTIIDINEREDDDNNNNRGPMGKHDDSSDDDDDDDDDRAISTSSTLLSNSIKDPMMEVAAQVDDDAIATPSSKFPLQNEGNDNVVYTTKQSDELEASAAVAENDDLDSDEGSLI